MKKTLVDRHAGDTTYTSFNSNNSALNPSNEDSTDQPFINIDQLTKILKKLPNKTSSGPDEISSIILKHLPPKIIRVLNILFKNATNHAYFPVA